ncbi:hypothetical protein JXQ70_01995 [bacterium]|nr:hypothetical protein [bacterium]
MGRDRVPEAKTLRNKLTLLVEHGDVQGWTTLLAQQWLDDAPDVAGYLYVDGHVRVYHGKQTKLPKRYLSRDRLCLRGTTDYWVNDALGQPYFSVAAAVDHGLLEILATTIVPRLLVEVPHQPSEKDLAENPLRPRFSLVFELAGYSPDFFAEMWQLRIACYTYKKYCQELWSEDEFQAHAVITPEGEIIPMELAERGTLLSSGQWIREIRKRTPTGHQTSLITTDYTSRRADAAASMFARWSQENFFRYMMNHYGLDKLVEYSTEELPETTKVVNPTWREHTGKIKKVTGLLQRAHAQFGAQLLQRDRDDQQMWRSEQKMASLHEDREYYKRELLLKESRRQMPHHISMAELPPAQQFSALAGEKKQLIDAIKMIAYRAETALVELIKPALAKRNEARALS